MFMAKTIKQIADELEVSKTAIRKKIDNLGLHESLQKNGNRILINEVNEKLIKSAFSRSKTKTSSQTSEETVSSLVSMLKVEIEAKNKQIAKLQQLLDQEQQLRMVSEKKLLLLEEKNTTDICVNNKKKKSLWHFW